MPPPDVIIKTLVADNKRGSGGEERRNCRTAGRMRSRNWVKDGPECHRTPRLNRLIWFELC